MNTQGWMAAAGRGIGGTTTLLMVALAAGCGGGGDEQDCRMPTLTAHADGDGDGYGDPDTARRVCEIPEGFVARSGDCDDTRDDVFDGAPEACDGVDNDCNDQIDDAIVWSDWWPDVDGDGFGDDGASPTRSCDTPAGHVAKAGDCDDGDDAIHPDADEICDGVDNDCDLAVDDEDPGIDPALLTTWWADGDGDGWGDDARAVAACEQPAGSVDRPGDCDDGDKRVRPDATEVCNGRDDDCDTLRDDDDPDVDPASQEVWYLDADGDTLGDAGVSLAACKVPAGYVADDRDCDDSSARVGAPQDWYADGDRDGYAGGDPVELGVCFPVDPTLVPDDGNLDCHDGDGAVYPGAEEVCGDGIDQDCDGKDLQCPLPVDCAAWQVEDPTLPSGVYAIEPTAGKTYPVYCDMVTDGGGWTLVGSLGIDPLRDMATSYHPDLKTLEPKGWDAGIWNGLRDVVGNVDMRFACKEFLGDTYMGVDLSVYDVDWYHEITSGKDGDSCFSEDDGLGYVRPAPSRRNNLTGEVLPVGDDWDAGYLEGENSCNDPSFTIDFDDRGVGGDPSDGTDWGLDGGVAKCGIANYGEAWFLFVRPAR